MSAPPLIAHVLGRLDYGGLENGVVNLINGLPAGLFRHAVVCLRGYSAFAKRIERDVEIVSVDKKPGKDFGAYARVWRLLRRLKPKIVHTRNLGTVDCNLVAATAGVPVRIHGLHGWDVDDLHGSSAKYRWLYRACDPAIDHYVAVSRHIGEWFSRSIGVRPDKIRQIYNGVDTERFQPVAGATPLPPGFAVGGTVFCSVGRIAAVKNHEALVRAFAALTNARAERRDRLRLAIVGDGPLRERVVSLASELGIAELCWFPGARDDVAAILASADVFVLPSLNEGISNTVLEAMGAGCAVVATAVGGNPELVEAEETGLLVPSGDVAALTAALARYDEQHDLARRHGDAGRRRVCERFSITRMLAEYQRFYEEAAAAAGARG